MSANRSHPLLVGTTLAACSLLMAACSSGSSSSGSSSSGSSAPVSTHPAGQPYLSKRGTGSTTLPTVALPNRSTLVWHFSCTSSGGHRSFILTSAHNGGAASKVTDQVGLSGGGYRPLKTAGVFTFAVNTRCSWQVLVTTEGIDTIPTTAPPSHSTTTTAH